jgi:hypothetical protein
MKFATGHAACEFCYLMFFKSAHEVDTRVRRGFIKVRPGYAFESATETTCSLAEHVVFFISIVIDRHSGLSTRLAVVKDLVSRKCDFTRVVLPNLSMIVRYRFQRFHFEGIYRQISWSLSAGIRRVRKKSRR